MADGVDLTGLPFDQYGRHRAAREIACLLRSQEGPERLAVLDVGGYPGLTRHFLPDDWVVVVDPLAEGEGSYLRASGLALPFQDASFDLVLSLDSLEHVPPPSRPRYLGELLRVARRYALVLAPCGSPDTERAEALVFEYVKIVLHAEHAQLLEHRAFGLPPLAATIGALEAGGAACQAFPNGYLYHWLPLMLLKHHLLALDPDAGAQAALDRWYNGLDPAFDRRLPAYRWGVLAGKEGRTPLLDSVAARLAPAEAAPEQDLLARQDLQVVLTLLAFERGNRGPAPLVERLAHQDRQIAALTHEVEALRAHLAAVRGGRVMRVLNAVNHLLGRAP
jgi:hypothetical protein